MFPIVLMLNLPIFKVLKISQSGKVPPVRFSPDEDKFLVEFVQKDDILYDLKHPEFKNTIKKDLLWNELGRILKKESTFSFKNTFMCATINTIQRQLKR